MSEKNRRRDFLRSIAVSGLAAGVGLPEESAADDNAPLHPSPMNPAGGRYINPRKVLLYECTRKEIREALIAGSLKAAIIPVGSTEQHNEHLAMIHDTASVLLVSQYAALQLYPRVIVTTPVAIGFAPHWMHHKGTLRLRKETFQAVVYDICESLKIHGIKTILILNGHGGNSAPLKEVVDDYRAKLGITLEACSYWDGIDKEFINKVMESKSGVSHAAEFETSFALAAFPERVRYQGVDYDRDRPQLLLDDGGYSLEQALKNFFIINKILLDDGVTYSPEQAHRHTVKWDKGTFEESKLATPEKGELIITQSVNWVAEKLLAMMG